jgi:signal transduction histidine kinase
VRVTGVCETVRDQNGALRPGFIWVEGETNVALVATLNDPPREPPVNVAPAAAGSAIAGFYWTRGVVTFKGRVFETNCLFIQEDAAALAIAQNEQSLVSRLEVGQCVELAGNLVPGKIAPELSPLVVTELGRRALPPPLPAPETFPIPVTREGAWTELEGVIHFARSNGTLALMGKSGAFDIFIAGASSNALCHYVDSKVRVRGALSLALQKAPLLLVPSEMFVDVEESGPAAPFALPVTPLSSLWSDASPAPLAHRVRVAGVVTYQEGRTFFLQDAARGALVETVAGVHPAVGAAVDVLGFADAQGAVLRLQDADARASSNAAAAAKIFDLTENFASDFAGSLVEVRGVLLGQRMNGATRELIVQTGPRIFEASLPAAKGALPLLALGSELRLVGVYDVTIPAADGERLTAAKGSAAAAFRILLRTPADVTLLRGPPWWTWRRAALLVGAMAMVLAGTLVWVRLLRNRLTRQQAAQLASSRQILQSQEGERRRIAANLHDGLGQNLLVIKNQACLAMHAAEDDPALRRRLDEISDVASQAIEEVRQVTLDLRPYHLDRLGLTQAIRATVSRAAENSSVSFATHVDDIDGAFDSEAEIQIYRIVQEAVHNIVKHSGATEAAVVIKRQAEAISLSIRDNGQGFDAAVRPGAGTPRVGYGLSGMRGRARILGGELEIDAKPGEGVSLSAHIPLPLLKS